jgi:iron complex outermembrane recepter protein
MRCNIPGFRVAFGLAVLASPLPAMAAPDGDTGPRDDELDTVFVTARLRAEDAQSVPVSLSVVGAAELDVTLTQSPQQLTQLVPSLNYSSPNPRNTALTIRGLGSSVVAIAQANDGLEPGVGFYVDQVYHARPATAAFDFMDLARVEVLRGPQGTLFGKNTTAGAMHLVTQAPDFATHAAVEVSGGPLDYHQVRGLLNATLVDGLLAGRLSGTVTDRDGSLRSLPDGQRRNDVNNAALRGQLLFTPVDAFSLRLTSDYSSIDTTCCTQVYVRVGSTLKTAARQYAALAASLNYRAPSTNPYDRLTDIDAGLKVRSNEGGVAAVAEWQHASFALTSVSAWRFWNWNAANDRDYTALSIQTLQGIPSRQDQYSQELRIASTGEHRLDYLAGLYAFTQTIEGHPTTAYGPQATAWLLGPAPTYPSNLLDGYRTDGDTHFTSDSYAAFGELTWHVLPRLDLTGGLRYTHEKKNGRYDAGVSGGLAPATTFLANARLSILRPQSYRAGLDDDSVGGRVTASFRLRPETLLYAVVSRGEKSGGINMSGLPLNASNLPALSAAVIRPERVTTIEAGVKAALFEQRATVNLDVFHTSVKDFQANVVDTGPGALRGYLANIDKVRVRGVEMDSVLSLGAGFAARLAAAWNDGEYVSYANGPCPLERIGNSTTVCDLSGRPLSTLPRWNLSAGVSYKQPEPIAGTDIHISARTDFQFRTAVYGDPADSIATQLGAYGIVNATIGLRRDDHWELLVWARNLFDRNYLQNVTIQAGNSGLVVGTPGDARSVGATLRVSFR